MAREKSNAIPTHDKDVLLTADTTVALGRRIFGKPENEKQAAEFLLALSGRRHRVITSIAVKHENKILERCVISTVKMKVISNLELNSYLMTEDWKGKAGGYGLQGPAAVFVPWIQGSFSGIIGLPLVETANLLRAVGVNMAFV
jgi:septum formation protein